MDEELPNDMRCEVYINQTDAKTIINLMRTSKSERELVRRCVKELGQNIPNISFIWQFRNLERIDQRLALNTVADIYLTATMKQLYHGSLILENFVEDFVNFIEIYVYGPVREEDQIIYYNRYLSDSELLFTDYSEYYMMAIIPYQLVLTYDRSKNRPNQAEPDFANMLKYYVDIQLSGNEPIEHIVIDLPAIDYLFEEELKATADRFNDLILVITEPSALSQLLKIGINVVVATRTPNLLDTPFDNNLVSNEIFLRVKSFTSFYAIETLYSFLGQLPNLEHLGIYLPNNSNIERIVQLLPKSIRYLTIYSETIPLVEKYENVEKGRVNYLIFNANNLRKYFNLPETVS